MEGLSLLLCVLSYHLENHKRFIQFHLQLSWSPATRHSFETTLRLASKKKVAAKDFSILNSTNCAKERSELVMAANSVFTG